MVELVKHDGSQIQRTEEVRNDATRAMQDRQGREKNQKLAVIPADATSTDALNTEVLSVNAIRTLAAATTKGVHDKILYAADVLKNSLAAYNQMDSEFKKAVTPEQLAEAAKIALSIGATVPQMTKVLTNPMGASVEGLTSVILGEGQNNNANAPTTKGGPSNVRSSR